MSAVKQQAAKTEFSLPNKKVFIRPIRRKGMWLPEGHSGNFLYDNASVSITVPIDSKTGRMANVLTSEERAFFEDPSRSGLDFKPGELWENRREGNFWTSFEMILRKTTEELDLSDPMQYLQYAMLRANTGSHGMIAPDWERRFDYPTYKYAIVEADYDAIQGAKKADDKLAAYKFFASVEDSFDKMYDFLTVYWLENPKGKKPSRTSKKDFLKSEIQELLDSDMRGVMAIVEDSIGYDRKLFLHSAMQNGHVAMEGRNLYKLMPENVVIGSSAREAVDYLYSPKNQEILLRIKALMEQV